VPLLRDPERIERMSAAIASTGSRDGADRMTDLVTAAVPSTTTR
jgi:UDP-N-acetylglucosamine:LPS N-acetylglucosamine transferase